MLRKSNQWPETLQVCHMMGYIKTTGNATNDQPFSHTFSSGGSFKVRWNNGIVPGSKK
jgi:outer membrane protein assembly factor BamA